MALAAAWFSWWHIAFVSFLVALDLRRIANSLARIYPNLHLPYALLFFSSVLGHRWNTRPSETIVFVSYLGFSHRLMAHAIRSCHNHSELRLNHTRTKFRISSRLADYGTKPLLCHGVRGYAALHKNRIQDRFDDCYHTSRSPDSHTWIPKQILRCKEPAHTLVRAKPH